MSDCPENHIEYASRMLADNMVTIHKMINPWCKHFSVFECGDHFHVGHSHGRQKQQCKKRQAEARAQGRWA